MTDLGVPRPFKASPSGGTMTDRESLMTKLPQQPTGGKLCLNFWQKGVGFDVQVQHAGLRDSCTADTLTVEFLVNAVHFLFPKFDYSWLVEEIKDSLPKVRFPILPSTMFHRVLTYNL